MLFSAMHLLLLLSLSSKMLLMLWAAYSQVVIQVVVAALQGPSVAEDP